MDLLSVACDYLVDILGCTSWPQLLSVHENVLYTVISFARSLLAITRDYLEGPIANIDRPDTAEMKNGNKCMQMFFVAENSKLVRPVEIGNVAGVCGIKKELPKAPDSESASNTAFIGTLHEYFDTKAQKAIVCKICIGKKGYENGLMDSTGTDCAVVDEIESAEPDEEPVTKRLRLSFEYDSDAENSD